MKYDDVVNIEFLYRDKYQTDPRFYVSYRGEDGKRYTVKDTKLFPSYFYIREEEEFLIENLSEEVRKNIIAREKGHTSMFEDKLIKLVFGRMSKQQFREARDNFTKTFEDDVLYKYRYIIDKKIKYKHKQRILYFDIETLLSLDIEDTPQPIISIAAYDNFTQKYFYFFYHPDAEKKKEKRKWVDGDGREHDLYIYFKDNEVEMLSDFMKFVRVLNPDVITAWNSDWFDLPYLINRIKKVGLYPGGLSTLNKAYTIVGKQKDQTRSMIYGMSIVDLKKVYEKMTYDNRPDSYSLSAVSKHTLNDDKVEMDGVKVLWNNKDKWEKLLEYNVKDVELCVRIDEKNNLMSFTLTVQQLIPIPAEDIMMNSRVVDMFLLQRYNGKFVFPSKRVNVKEEFSAAFAGKLTKLYEKDNPAMFKRYIEDNEPYILDEDEEGKFIWYGKEPEAKVFKNVAVLDFSSMYPSIYRTFNISPDTLDENGDILVDDVRFTTRKPGMIPGILEELLIERKKLEKERDAIEDTASTEYMALHNKQGAMKAIGNSIFGVMGFPNFRLYNIKIAKSVTYMGRLFIAILDKEIRKLGYSTIYSDTDSVFVIFPEDMSEDETLKAAHDVEEKMGHVLEKYAFEMGAKKSYLKIDAEKIFKNILFRGVKKQYFGRLFYKKGHHTNEIFSRGMDIVRRDTPRAIRGILKEVIEHILNKDDMKEVRKRLDAQLEEIRGLSAWEIGSTKRLSKNIRPLDLADDKVTVDTYKNNNIQNVKACLFSNTFLGTAWEKADYPKLVFVNMKPTGKDKSNINDFLKKWGLSEIDCIAVDENTELPSWIEIDYDKTFEKYVYMRLKLFENVEGVNVRRLYSKNTFLSDWFDLETEVKEPETREELDAVRKVADEKYANSDGWDEDDNDG